MRTGQHHSMMQPSPAPRSRPRRWRTGQSVGHCHRRDRSTSQIDRLFLHQRLPCTIFPVRSKMSPLATSQAARAPMRYIKPATCGHRTHACDTAALQGRRARPRTGGQDEIAALRVIRGHQVQLEPLSFLFTLVLSFDHSPHQTTPTPARQGRRPARAARSAAPLTSMSPAASKSPTSEGAARKAPS